MAEFFSIPTILEHSDSSVPMRLRESAMTCAEMTNLSAAVGDEVGIAGLFLIEVSGGGESAGHLSK